jgi:hypothetical protein
MLVVEGDGLEDVLEKESRLGLEQLSLSKFVPPFARREENCRMVGAFHGKYARRLAERLGVDGSFPAPAPVRRLKAAELPQAIAGQFLFDGGGGRVMTLVPQVSPAEAAVAAAVCPAEAAVTDAAALPAGAAVEPVLPPAPAVVSGTSTVLPAAAAAAAPVSSRPASSSAADPASSVSTASCSSPEALSARIFSVFSSSPRPGSGPQADRMQAAAATAARAAYIFFFISLSLSCNTCFSCV